MNKLSKPGESLNLDLYLRKSRTDVEEERKALSRGEEYDTLARHRNQLLAKVKKENHSILQIHEEVVSGESVSERPEIQNLIRRIENEEIDAVLVVDMDRLGRGDMLDQGILDRAFRYSGTKLLTLTDYYDPEDESWELVFGIKSLVSRQELKAITRRLQSGRKDSVDEGKSISKKPPYGYLRNEHLKLHPCPETSWVVKKMFEMMRDGHGRQAIAQELDKLGIAPPDNRRSSWSPSSITAIIKNEVYLGHIIWGKFKYIKRNGKYKRAKQPPEKWRITKNAHEAIISEELFELANKSHSGRYRPHTVQSKGLSNPFAGVLKCGVCGYALLYQPRKERPSNGIRCIQPGCRGVQKGASFSLVEDRILQTLNEYINEFTFTTEEGNQFDDTPEIDLKYKAIKAKQKELNELNVQKSNLHDLLESKVYTIDTFLERQSNLAKRIEKVEKEVAALEGEIEKGIAAKKNIKEIVPQILKVLEAYRYVDDIDKKNKLMKSIIETATFIRKKEWTKPDQFEIEIFLRL